METGACFRFQPLGGTAAAAGARPPAPDRYRRDHLTGLSRLNSSRASAHIGTDTLAETSCGTTAHCDLASSSIPCCGVLFAGQHASAEEAIKAVDQSGFARRPGARTASRVHGSDRARHAARGPVLGP